ncbi:hypothetical protein A8F94_19145 [Bacillus sp. FJAT-27225]|nr:hypothetical protein A8F94_19145 [Bacillus sp. FJAT-27225]
MHQTIPFCYKAKVKQGDDSYKFALQALRYPWADRELPRQKPARGSTPGLLFPLESSHHPVQTKRNSFIQLL